MKTIKKDVFLRTITAALVILLSLFLVTCIQEEFPEEEGDNIEWLDWKYEDNPDGSGKLTLMLDGSKPFAYNDKQQRGLNMDIAKMTHDYFEAVFLSNAVLPTAGAGATGTVARTNWEIGMPAGVAGLNRGPPNGPGIDYGNVFPAANNGAASVVFVGKKQGKTLLGIGQLVQVNDGAVIRTDTVITGAATSVIYGVYPMHTKVGFDPDGAGIPNWDEATFITAVDRPIPTVTTPLTGPEAGTGAAAGKTAGKILDLPGPVKYPLFQLPAAVNDRTIAATYTIGGLFGGVPNTWGVGTKRNLWDAARVLTTTIGVAPNAKTYGLEIIKRYAAYQVQGQTFDASKALDTYTEVAPGPIASPKNQTAHEGFDAVIEMVFTQKTQSNGIFAITFQCPVYAITQALASNAGGTVADKWYIRPGSNQYQFLLDNGTDAGGMVMLGIDTAGVVDWLEIFTVGIGFVNN